MKQDSPNWDALTRLSEVIKLRRKASPDESYVARLLAKGPKKCAQKVGEEAVEVAIAATSEEASALTSEAADLLFHLMVLLESRDLSLEEVVATLADREDISGLVEKAARTETPSL